MKLLKIFLAKTVMLSLPKHTIKVLRQAQDDNRAECKLPTANFKLKPLVPAGLNSENFPIPR